MYATPGARDLYFVARGDGRHMFAQTYAQHLANIAAARALQAAMASRRAQSDSLPGLSPAALAADSAR